MPKLRKTFGLRVLIALVAVAALLLSFVAREQRRRAAQERAIAEIAGLGGRIGYDIDGGRFNADRRPVVAITLGGRETSDATLASVRPLLDHLTELEVLDLRGSRITDAGLAHLRGLKGLRHLSLAYVPTVTDSGIGQLGFLSQLEDINLTGTKVTSEGLSRLRGLKHLRGLVLNETKLSDADLERLANELERYRFWPRFEWMNLDVTFVTDGGVQRLLRVLPNSDISNNSPRTRGRP
jgi:hypothetical protein